MLMVRLHDRSKQHQLLYLSRCHYRRYRPVCYDGGGGGGEDGGDVVVLLLLMMTMMQSLSPLWSLLRSRKDIDHCQ